MRMDPKHHGNARKVRLERNHSAFSVRLNDNCRRVEKTRPVLFAEIDAHSASMGKSRHINIMGGENSKLR